MAAFDKLPYEMMTEILSLLPAGDLASMAVVSHQLHHVALPLLYKAPSLLCHHGPRTQRQCFNIFLWTMLTPGRESLAAHVRSLTWYWYPPRSTPNVPCPSEKALIAPAASRFGLRRTTHSQSAKFVLLIHLFPHLEVLHTSCPSQHSSFTNFMDSQYTGLGLPTTTTPVLQSLREFHSVYLDPRSGHQRQCGVSHKTLLVLLALPCIRRIETCIAPGEPLPADAIEGHAASSPVTHLRLWDADSTPCYLLPALTVPRALTHFSYSTVRYQSGFNLGAFWAAMRPLSATVVCLHLDLLLMGLQEDDPVAPFGTGKSAGLLVEWTALRTLSCSIEALMGRPTAGKVGRMAWFLPRGLREMEIVQGPQWEYGKVVEEIVGLMARKDVVVPYLERVAAKTLSWVIDVEGQETLKGACEPVGVAVVETVSISW